MTGTDRVYVVRGRPTAQEVAAVVEAVRAARTGERDRYEAWRAGRLTALRSDPRHPIRPRR